MPTQSAREVGRREMSRITSPPQPGGMLINGGMLIKKMDGVRPGQ